MGPPKGPMSGVKEKKCPGGIQRKSKNILTFAKCLFARTHVMSVTHII